MKREEKIARAAFIDGAVDIIRRALNEHLGARIKVFPDGEDTFAELTDAAGVVLLSHQLAGVQLTLPLVAPAVEAPPVEVPAPKPCVHTWGRIEGEHGDHWYSCVWCDTAVIEGHADFAAIDARHRRNALLEAPAAQAPAVDPLAPGHRVMRVGDLVVERRPNNTKRDWVVTEVGTSGPTLRRDDRPDVIETVTWAHISLDAADLWHLSSEHDEPAAEVSRGDGRPVEAPAPVESPVEATDDEGTPNSWGGTWLPLHSYRRPDGATVALERDGSYRRVVVTSAAGEHLMQPHELLKGDAGRWPFIRHAAEPVLLDKPLRDEVKAAAVKMRGLKRAEREAIENLMEMGRARALASMLDGFGSRKGGDEAKSVGARVKAVAEAAEAALPPDVLAALDVVAPARKFAKITDADVSGAEAAIRTIAETAPVEAPASPASDITGLGVGDVINLDGVRVEVLGVDEEGFVWRTVDDLDNRDRDEGDTAWSEVEHVTADVWSTHTQAVDPPLCVLIVHDEGADAIGAIKGLNAWHAAKTPGAGSLSGGDCRPLVMLWTPDVESDDVDKLLARYAKVKRPVLDLGVIRREDLNAHEPWRPEMRAKWNAVHPEHRVSVPETTPKPRAKATAKATVSVESLSVELEVQTEKKPSKAKAPKLHRQTKEPDADELAIRGQHTVLGFLDDQWTTLAIREPDVTAPAWKLHAKECSDKGVRVRLYDSAPRCVWDSLDGGEP